MSFNANWDVDKYKTEFESEEHWQLRRSFMMTHKKKIPEERLVCLSRVFTNVEFLGCRYPAETMSLVDQLSRGVADEYRKKQKTKLQRTFVKASDAAEAKFKGLKRPLGDAADPSNSPPKILKCTDISQLPQRNISTTSDIPECSGNIQLPQTSVASTSEILKDVENKQPMQKRVFSTTETSERSETMQPLQKTVSSSAWVVSEMDSNIKSTSSVPQLPKTRAFVWAPEPSKKLTKDINDQLEGNDIGVNGCDKSDKNLHKDDTNLIKKEAKINPKSNGHRLKKDVSKVGSYRDLDSEMSIINTVKFGKLILIEDVCNTHPFNVLTRSTTLCGIPFRVEYLDQPRYCKVYVNNHLLTSSCGYNRKQARDFATKEAYEKLSQICYTLKIKSKINSDGSVMDRATFEKSNSQEEPLDDNIGSKMMRAMGWSGGGLGKEQQGMKEPIKVTRTIRRTGLGLVNTKSKAKFRENILKILEEYSQEIEPYDLVFSSEFTKEERGITHQLCVSLGLQSKSYGINEERRIIVSHKKDFRKIVANMLASGQYSNELYELIKPPISLPPENEMQSKLTPENNAKCVSPDEPSVSTTDVSATSHIPKEQTLSDVAEVSCENISSNTTKPMEFEERDIVGVSQRNTDGITGPFGCLVLIEDETVVTPIQLIEKSANGCHIPFKFEYAKVKGGMRCSLLINNILVASSTEVSKKQAREVTVSRSLEKLKDVCYTLKHQIKVVDDTISIIKCLRKPNKKSFGCGDKDSETHIVCVSKEVDLPSLGVEHALSLVTFKDKVKNFLQKYQADTCPYDLVFSPEFSGPEKTWIHKIASNLTLKTTNYDISKKHFMVISKKLSVIELAMAILSSGGNVSADSVQLENIFIL